MTLTHASFEDDQQNITFKGNVPGLVVFYNNFQVFGSLDRNVNGSVVHNGSQSAIASGIAQAEWHSGDTLNGNGKNFTLYLLPKFPFTHDDTGATMYQSLCGMAGLQTVGNGMGYRYNRPNSYWHNCEQYGCMPLPDNHDGSGTCEAALCALGQCTCCDAVKIIGGIRHEPPECWGSSNNAKDAVQTHTGWSDFLIHDYDTGGFPFACRGLDCYQVAGRDHDWSESYHPHIR